MANIKYQFLQAINNSFKPNMDKHSIKKTEGHTDKIFSYAARKNVINVASDFANFLKENYTGDEKIRYVKEIEVQHLNSYMISKKDKCTNETLKQIGAQLRKLELVCNKKYNLNVDWHTCFVLPQNNKKSIRTVGFSQGQVEQMNKYLSTKKDCYGKRAIYVAERWGLRAQEIEALKCKDFDLKKMELFVSGCGAKGGRCRRLSIYKGDLPLIEFLCKGKGANDRVIPIRKNSICNYLHNICVQLGFKNILKSKSSIHALRKYCATNYYHNLLAQGFCKQEAQGMVCEFLGHSRSRADIARHYILEDRKE